MRRLVLIPLGVAVACAAAPGAESPPQSPTAVSDQSTAPVTTVATPPTEPESTAGAAADASVPEPEEDPSCPTGMKLVEGDYCTKVEQNCVKHWFDKSNKKKVCEEFAPPSQCIGKRVRKKFCIDTYSWPNQKGARPEVMNTFYQAQVKCAAVGKRMCTESEWTFACEGPEMKPFPHGYVRDAKKCNGDHKWDSPKMTKVARRDPVELARLWKGVRSGSQPDCISDFGVADLPANNDEVVSSETFTSDWRGKYSSVHTGGPWYKGVRNQCRPKIYTHDEGFYYYFLGFRCCAEPDGAESDPRTPKQARANWKFDRVERLAGFDQEDVRKAIAMKKEKGHCDCKPCPAGARCPKSAQRCNTLCGTLLGEGATDADGSHLDSP